MSFEDECRELCTELTTCASLIRPGWTAHPDRRKRISARRFELYTELRRADTKVVRYQYVFGPRTILVGLYLTSLGEDAERACDQLEAAREAIESSCHMRTRWDLNRNQQRIRFRILAVSTRLELEKYGADQQMIRRLAELMWRFQESTMPVLGIDPSGS